MRRHGCLLLLATVLPAVPGCGRSPATADQPLSTSPQLEVEVTKVGRASMRSELDLVGTLIPIRTTTIVSEVDGVIHHVAASSRKLGLGDDGSDGGAGRGTAEGLLRLGLDIGDEVKKGEILVEIEPTDFQLQLAEAKAERELAQRELEDLLAWKRAEEVDRLKATLKRVRAAHQRAQADLDRAERLLARNAIPQSEYDRAVMEARTAAAALEEADAAARLYLAGPTEQKIAVAKARVAAAEAHVASKQEKLNKTKIRAPYDAVVADRYVEVGERVTAMPRVEIMQILDPDVLFAEVAVPERHQGRVRLGERATVISAEGVSVTGKVDRINSKIDAGTRTFRVRVTIDNTRQVLKPGGFVHVRLPLETRAEVVAVPRNAVTFAEGRPSVFLYRDGRVYKTPVSLGMTNGSRQEIRSGLSEGQTVVVGNTSLLSDGLPVRLKPAVTEATGAEEKQL